MSVSSIVSAQHKPLAVYVHWPFCKKKCPYCDFNSHVRDGVDHDAWREALLRELRYWRQRSEDHHVTSIFFGGGTPSLMAPATVAAIIGEVRNLWPTAGDIEITLEANPTSVEAKNFSTLRDAGVNRVSLGVQSLREDSLKFLGREHSASEALEAVALARDIFPRYSFDLIYALPNQSLQMWEKELRAALDHARGHLSLYQLTIEPNTAFHHQYHVARDFTLPEDSLAADMYDLTQQVMDEAGLSAYEISNHAAPGQESRHNISYWQSDSYLGVGPGAHGRVDHGDIRIATQNFKSPERWLEQVARLGQGLEQETSLSETERAEETLLMGLRLTAEGLDLNRLPAHARAVVDTKAQSLIQQGLLTRRGDRLIVSASGRPVLNAITGSLACW